MLFDGRNNPRSIRKGDAIGRISGMYIGAAAQIKDTVITNAKLVSPPSTTLVAETVLGSANQTIAVTGLDLDTDDGYFIEIYVKQATAAAGKTALYCNADFTAGNYTELCAYHATATTTMVGTTAGDPYLTGALSTNQNQPLTMQLWMRNDVDSKVSCNGIGWTSGAANYVFLVHWLWNTTSTNVTTLSVISDQVNGFATGSYVRIYKVD